jgi:hypothetical protein
MLNDTIKKERGESASFVISDLDETHLFITPNEEIIRMIKAKVNSQLEESRNPKSALQGQPAFFARKNRN